MPGSWIRLQNHAETYPDDIKVLLQHREKPITICSDELGVIETAVFPTLEDAEKYERFLRDYSQSLQGEQHG